MSCVKCEIAKIKFEIVYADKTNNRCHTNLIKILGANL